MTRSEAGKHLVTLLTLTTRSQPCQQIKTIQQHLMVPLQMVILNHLPLKVNLLTSNTVVEDIKGICSAQEQ